MSSNQSLPNHFLKLLTPTILEASFHYNFFEPSELVEELPKSSFETTTDAEILKISKRTPRFNRLDITPNFSRFLERKIDLLNNAEITYSQNDFSKIPVSSLNLQDTEVDNRTLETIQRSARLREINGSLTDVSLRLSKEIPGINSNLLQEFAANTELFLNSTFSQGDKEITNDELITSQNYEFSINSRYIFDALSKRLKVPFGNYALTTEISRVFQIQDKIRKLNQFSGGSSYLVELSPLNFEETLESSSLNELFLAGIAVFRKEVFSTNNEDIRLLDIIQPNSTRYLDFQIKTNTKYSYFLSNVYLAKIASKSSETFDPGVAEFLLFSSISNSKTVKTIDKIPPPPPVDFIPRWDYQERCLVISWSMPVNSQRDIKYFQVLRRNNIQEPFELLVEYDFNDIEGFVSRGDIPSQENTRVFNSLFTIFIDKEFRKNSDFIYTLASIDAKGLVSNYSEQLRIRFDIVKNRLIVEQISPSGAPRIYPNAFIKQDLFIDSIITKNNKHISVYFDPEYLKIVDKDKNDLGLILNKDKGRYVISVIDIDRGQSIKIPLSIQDLRESK